MADRLDEVREALEGAIADIGHCHCRGCFEGSACVAPTTRAGCRKFERIAGYRVALEHARLSEESAPVMTAEEWRVFAREASEPAPPPVCTGSGTPMTDARGEYSQLPSEGRCGICGQTVPINMRDWTVVTHPWREPAQPPATRPTAYVEVPERCPYCGKRIGPGDERTCNAECHARGDSCRCARPAQHPEGER